MHSRRRVKDTKAAVVFSSFPQCTQHVENIYQPSVCVPEASLLMRLFSVPQGILLNLDPHIHGVMCDYYYSENETGGRMAVAQKS